MIKPAPLTYYGGLAGTLAPFVLFLSGVIWLGLSGAPDERGFWPILVAALALALLLVKDRAAWCEAIIQGMSQSIVALMILAWLFAGILASLMRASGLVESLVWIAQLAGLFGAGFVIVSFLIACAVSTSTGTSLGTLLLCVPLLYPAGGALGADPLILMGAILGGATFGDNISPVSDTTIASALTQEADLGGVVRSRLRYALPAAFLALLAYGFFGGLNQTVMTSPMDGNLNGLPMLGAPILVIVLLLRRRHLVEGLLFGILAAVGIGLVFGLLAPSDLIYIDAERFSARGLIVDGIERGIGISIFTLLLMGLVAGMERAGLLDRLVRQESSASQQGTEWRIFSTVAAAAILTTHSVVAILSVGPLAKRLGEAARIHRYRRANLLDVTVCTFPFLLPYCIPTLLAASLTAGSQDLGMPTLTAFRIGLVNFHSWALLAVILFAIATGFGRDSSPANTTEV